MNATDWLDAVGWALLHFLWQGSIAAVALAVLLCGVKTPAVRYRAATAVLCLLPCFPVATAIYLMHGSGPTVGAPVAMSSIAPVPIGIRLDSSDVAYGDAQPTGGRHDPIAWVVLAWAIGAGALGCVNFAGWTRVRRLARAGRPMSEFHWQQRLGALAKRMGVRRAVILLETAAVPSPAVIGHLKPVILMPISLAAALAPDQVEMILAHELAHILRCDFLINLAQAAIEAVLFYHPAVWWISAQVRREREACCDEIAVATCGGDAIAYARTLADLEGWRSVPRPALAASTAPVFLRVRRLLGLREARQAGPAALVAAALVACIVLPLAATRLWAASPDDNAMTAIHIVTASGRPAAGAHLTLLRQDNGADDAALLETSADGAGIAWVPTDLLRSGTHPVGLQAIADEAGAGLTVAPISLEPPSLTIQLAQPSEATITFVGPDDRPIPNLRVAPVMVLPGELRFESVSTREHIAALPPVLKNRLTAQTDANGIATFTGFSGEQRVRLEVEDDRFAALQPMTDDLVLGSAHARLQRTVRLSPGAVVRGNVRFGPTGKPAVRVQVSAQGVDDFDGWGSAVTDERGNFEIRRLRAGKYDIAPDLAKAGLDNAWTAIALNSVPVQAGAHVEGQDLTLTPGIKVEGSVVDSASGRPLDGVEIGLYGPAHPRSGGWVQSAATDAAGKFSARVPAGDQQIYVMGLPDGYVGPEEQWVTAVEGKPLVVRFALHRDPHPPCRGQVLTADGKPAAGAMVIADITGKLMEPASESIADSSGHYRFSAIPDGTLLRARLGDSSTAAPVRVTSRNRDNLTLLIAVGVGHHPLVVQVKDLTGRPFAHATVFLTSLSQGMNVAISKATDNQGECTFSEIFRDEDYELMACAPQCNSYEASLARAPAGGDLQRTTIQLVQATDVVTGRIVDGPGPWKGVKVEMTGGWQQWTRETMADVDGRFRFDQVDTGAPLMIRSDAPWGVSQWQNVSSEVRPTPDGHRWFPGNRPFDISLGTTPTTSPG